MYFAALVLKHFNTLHICITQAEELPPEFSQADLASDDIMILDTWDQVGSIYSAELSKTLKVILTPNLSPVLPDISLDWKGCARGGEKRIHKNWSVYLEVKMGGGEESSGNEILMRLVFCACF